MTAQSNTKRFFTLWLTGSLLLSAFYGALPSAAERLESDSYVIQFGNFNVTSGEKSSENYTVTDTVGQVGAGPYGEYGDSSYFVGGGFQYIYQIPQFSFVISKTHIDFGTLILDTHETDSHTLTITTPGGSGYAVYAYQEHPLLHKNGTNTIPDTTCNASDCDQTTAGVWTTQTIPGFGFNVTGDGTPADFTDSTYFRQFANLAGAEPMQVVMSSDNIAQADEATITYKVGVTSQEAAGEYETAVVYVAVPGY